MSDYIPTLEDYETVLGDYLPYLDNETHNDYLDYIRHAYWVNTRNDKLQFAILAFHMLFMSFIYKTLWIMRHKYPSQTSSFCDKNKIRQDALSSFFKFSIAGEKTAIKELELLDFHPNEIKAFSSLVDIRDNCAHCSGVIQYPKEEDVVAKIKEILKSVDVIFKKSSPLIIDLFKRYLNTLEQDPKTLIIKISIMPLVEELKKDLGGGFSLKDIDLISDYKWSFINDKKNNDTTIRKKVFLLYVIRESREDVFIDKFAYMFKNTTKQELFQIIIEHFGFLADTSELREISEKMKIDLSKSFE